MSKTLHLEILTPQGITYQGEVESVVLPGLAGSFGVLPGHIPLVAVLKAGEANYRAGGRTEYLAFSGGYVQVNAQKVTVLAETAELAAQIDLARAEAAAKAKDEALKTASARLDPAEYAKIQASLLKELVRVKVAGKKKQGG